MGTVKIYDERKNEYISYDTEKERAEMMVKLAECAAAMQTPVFHSGNLAKEQLLSENYKISDSFGFTMERNRFDSQGSGVFYASNLPDVLDWMENHLDNKSRLYALDLAPYQKEGMLRLKTDDESDFWSEMLEDISRSVLDSAKTGNSHARSVYLEYAGLFRKHGIDYENYSVWYREETERIRGLLSAPEKWRKEYSISTSFQEKLLGAAGVDLSSSLMDDSVARGSILFHVNPNHAYDIDFGDNKDIAERFYSMVFEKIMDRKLQYLEKEDIPYLVNNYALEGCVGKMKSKEMIVRKLEAKYHKIRNPKSRETQKNGICNTRY